MLIFSFYLNSSYLLNNPQKYLVMSLKTLCLKPYLSLFLIPKIHICNSDTAFQEGTKPYRLAPLLLSLIPEPSGTPCMWNCCIAYPASPALRITLRPPKPVLEVLLVSGLTLESLVTNMACLDLSP